MNQPDSITSAAPQIALRQAQGERWGRLGQRETALAARQKHYSYLTGDLPAPEHYRANRQRTPSASVASMQKTRAFHICKF